MKNNTFVEFAFYMGFPDLIRVTSSAENIDLARKKNYDLNKKSAPLKMFSSIISTILQKIRSIG